MPNLNLLNVYRVTDPAALRYTGGWAGDETCGMFSVPSKIDGGDLKIIASNAEGWDHVSISRRNRCPNWSEMEQVAALFFRDGEVAMQLHVPTSDHINTHPYCLHWWRPHDVLIPRDPHWMIGLVGSKPLSPDEAFRAADELRRLSACEKDRTSSQIEEGRPLGVASHEE